MIFYSPIIVRSQFSQGSAMPVLVERQRVSRRKILFLKPYILWRRGKEIAAEKLILSDIKREEEEKARAIERERKDKEDKKRAELQEALDEAKEIQSEVAAVRLHREELEEKLKLLHEEKHRLFVCLKTLLTPKDNQRKTKPTKDQIPPPHIGSDRLHGLAFSPSGAPGKFPGETFPRNKMELAIYQASPLKRPRSPIQNIPFPYLEQTPPLQQPYTSMQQFYGRGAQTVHQEQPFLDMQAANRADYEPHKRLQQQRQEFGRSWQQSAHKSPSISDRRGHPSRQSYATQGPNYSSANYTHSKSAAQQRKAGSKH